MSLEKLGHCKRNAGEWGHDCKDEGNNTTSSTNSGSGRTWERKRKAHHGDAGVIKDCETSLTPPTRESGCSPLPRVRVKFSTCSSPVDWGGDPDEALEGACVVMEG